MFTCLRNFCQWSTCPAHPDAKCRVNPCGGCKVEFVDKSGKVVSCNEGITCIFSKSVQISITEWVINTGLFTSGHMHPGYLHGTLRWLHVPIVLTVSTPQEI